MRIKSGFEPIPTREEYMESLVKRHGKERQERFLNAKAAVCGLGGLGSNIAVALARAGVGTLHLIDYDCVDLSNVNRQQYMLSQVGKKKTDAMKEIITAVNPYIKVVTDSVKISGTNLSLLSEDDIICEAFDGAEQKAMLVNGVLEKYPQKYIVAASGMAGMYSANDIRTRKITNHFFLCGDGESDADGDIGLVAARVMVCAAHQAHMVLRIIDGIYDA
ncbi:MAG: sulfur carrier protein ThiS adenylyltransferase ThiF [Lachnospiraceae bacterium]|nr:sulfur carrier protein ThiS adenylyltransferase ThiF [Lachnospiraceae bacterium]